MIFAIENLYLRISLKICVPKNKWEVNRMPNKVGQVYLCEICGNKVEMLVAGKGTLICCGQPMKLVEEKK